MSDPHSGPDLANPSGAENKGVTPGAGNSMWGGRFAAKPSEIMTKINASIGVDQRLWRQDIQGSKAHAAMLAGQGIISAEDNTAIQAGLDAIHAEIEGGQFVFSVELEDIHLNIEARLTERIGDAGKRLHTGRSRNDQVATDFRLWCGQTALDLLSDALKPLQRILAARALEHADWVMPGFTHLQTAQPITLGHHLLAYVEMLERDARRLKAASDEALTDCPLGSAALAGTVYPIDRTHTAAALGFAQPGRNSLDGVSARDFALQLLSALSIGAVHFSRLAEEIVFWTSPQFGFARLSDEWSTGSSIMPQKRNPDAAELIRAKAAQISAQFQALSGLIKALPLAYAKDLQDDKTITFQAVDDYLLCAQALAGMMATMTFNRANLRDAATRGYSTATDLADWLVRALNMPFREAHHVTGSVVKRAEMLGIAELSNLPLAEFQAIEPRITDAAVKLLRVEDCAAARQSYGGTAPDLVQKQAEGWLMRLATNEGAL